MSECHIRGCRSLETKCKDCGRLVADRILPTNEWIKVEDGLPPLPKYTERYLVYATFDYPEYGKPDFQVYEADYNKNGDWEYGEFDYPLQVTHWMALPEEPHD